MNTTKTDNLPNPSAAEGSKCTCIPSGTGSLPLYSPYCEVHNPVPETPKSADEEVERQQETCTCLTCLRDQLAAAQSEIQQHNAEREETFKSLGWTKSEKAGDDTWHLKGYGFSLSESILKQTAAYLKSRTTERDQLRASLAAESDEVELKDACIKGMSEQADKMAGQISGLQSELATAQKNLAVEVASVNMLRIELGETKEKLLAAELKIGDCNCADWGMSNHTEHCAIHSKSSLRSKLQSAMEERDAARASAISWESTARSLSDATLPCGHPEACAIDLSEEGKPEWSSIGCVWCQLSTANSRLEEAEKSRETLLSRLGEAQGNTLALQAHVKELRTSLGYIVEILSDKRNSDDSTIHAGNTAFISMERWASEALSSQPDLGLVEEVIAMLEKGREYAFRVMGDSYVEPFTKLLSRLSTSRSTENKT